MAFTEFKGNLLDGYKATPVDIRPHEGRWLVRRPDDKLDRTAINGDSSVDDVSKPDQCVPEHFIDAARVNNAYLVSRGRHCLCKVQTTIDIKNVV